MTTQASSSQRPGLWARLSVVAGNLVQLVGLVVGTLLLYLDECCVVCFEIKRRPSDIRTKGASQTLPEKRYAWAITLTAGNSLFTFAIPPMLDGSDDLYLLGDLSGQMHASSIGKGVPHRKSRHDQDHSDAECERRYNEARRYQGDQRGDRDHARPG